MNSKLTLLVLVFLIGCNQNTKNNTESTIADIDREIQWNVDSTKNEIQPNDSILRRQHFNEFNSSEYAFEIGMKSIFSSSLEGLIINKTTLDVTVFGDNIKFTNQWLKGGYEIEQLIKNFNNYSIDTLDTENIVLYKLHYGNSKIFIPELDNATIPYAYINHYSIPLEFGIQIGMSTEGVLMNLFKTSSIDGLEQLERILIGEVVGNYYTYLNFNNNTLSSIEFGFYESVLMKNIR